MQYDLSQHYKLHKLSLIIQNDKQLIQQQNTLIDLLRTEEVTEEQIYEYKEELQSIAKGIY